MKINKRKISSRDEKINILLETRKGFEKIYTKLETDKNLTVGVKLIILFSVPHLIPNHLHGQKMG